jgi:hypothetical protein
MKFKALSVFSVLILFLSGCATNKSMYVWGDYSDSLYKWRKDATDERAVEHKVALADIIKRSEAKGSRVPPGVYCEYGYMLLMEGEQEKALSFFEREAAEYPESKEFVSFLLTRCKESGGEEASDDAQND